MRIRPETGLTFDDVLLVPHRSAVRSRRDADTSTWLAPGLRMAIPILSANMDTVTEARMAIAMAQQGGIGILHRFMTIEQQADMVRKVKRAESLVVDHPIAIRPEASVAEARQKMEAADIGGLMVTDADNQLLGVVTTRDVLLARQPDLPVSMVMTPRERLVTGARGESLEEARQKLFDYRIEKLPLVDSDGRLAGLITAQDIQKIQEHPNATKDHKGRLRVGAALGTRPDDLERARACVQAGADILVVDIAHGHSEHTLQMVNELKASFPRTPIIAGNVATAQGVSDLVEAGAAAVKVGVGSGSICITRVVTGFGVPQLTAISECAEAGRSLGAPIIADGGIRTSGDIVKAIAAGASSVMIGSLLAGTDESPGAAVIRDGRRFKIVRGMASLTANIERKSIEKGGLVAEEDWGEVVAEGVEAVVPYRGAASDILHQLVGGLRSGLSYAGARTIEELWEVAEFIRITGAGQKESGVHDVSKI